MPPKSKGSKTTKTTQLRRRVPRTTRRTAGTDDTLPDVAELFLAKSKQVHFADEGGEYAMETDGSEGEGEVENEDADVDRQVMWHRIIRTFEVHREEEGDEGVEEDGEPTSPAKATPKATSKARKGRVVGSKGFSNAKEWIIAEGVEEELPRGEIGWRKVGKYFNNWVPQDRQQHWEVIRNKHGRMMKWTAKVPTGDSAGSKLRDKLLQIEDLRLAKEATAAIDDEYWSDSDAPAPKPTKAACIKSNPPLSPAPPPFGCSQPTPSKPTTRADQSEVIVLSSTDEDNPAPPPQTTPAKRKARPTVKMEPGVKTEPGVAYYAEKVPEVAEVKSPVKRRGNSRALLTSIQSTLSNDSNTVNTNSAGVAKVELFGRDRMIERLEKDLTESRERCHQLERQADNVVMIMTMFGIPVPEATGGPALGRALAGFLQARIPASVPPATVLGFAAPNTPGAASAATPVPAGVTAPVVVPPTTPVAAPTPAAPMSPLDAEGNSAWDIPIDPTLYEHSGPVPLVSVASGSSLSATEKGKLPMYPGN